MHLIHSDHLNSPRALTNARSQGSQASGTTVWRWDLLAANTSGSNAFGSQVPNEDTDANSTLVKFDQRFPGKQYDSETGLNYNYFRDYESGAGRYVESDPIGLDGGISTFGYVSNAPLSSFDPFGMIETRNVQCKRQHWKPCEIECPYGVGSCRNIWAKMTEIGATGKVIQGWKDTGRVSSKGIEGSFCQKNTAVCATGAAAAAVGIFLIRAAVVTCGALAGATP